MSSKRVEIRIVTGPGGDFMGSEILIDGESPKYLTAITIQGSVGEKWTIQSDQIVMPSPSPDLPLLGGGDE